MNNLKNRIAFRVPLVYMKKIQVKFLFLFKLYKKIELL